MGKLVNRAKMKVASAPGTGSFVFGAAVPPYDSSTGAGVADGDVVSYVAEDGTNFEEGQGTWTAATSTLARTTITRSSNANAAISASANTMVSLVAFADDIVGTAKQTLSDAKIIQARQNIVAAPFDAMADLNILYNGSMEVTQPIGNTVFSNASGYVLDGWNLQDSGAQVMSAQQSGDAPPGYNKSLLLTVTSGNGVPLSTDYLMLYQTIEMYRGGALAWGSANGQPAIIGFWFKSTVTGNFGVSFSGSNSGLFYLKSFNYASANTWQYVTIVIQPETTGLWMAGWNTAFGLLRICLMSGSSYTGTEGVWGSSNIIAPASQVNGAQSSLNTFQITGAVMLPGVELPSAANAYRMRRHYERELHICQRYFEKSYGPMQAPGMVAASSWQRITEAAGNYQTIMIPYNATKRIAPTVTLYSPNNGATGKIYNITGAVNVNAVVLTSSIDVAVAQVNNVAVAAASTISVHWTVDSRF